MELVGLDTESTGLDYWSPDWRLRLVQMDNGTGPVIFDISEPGEEDAARMCLEQGQFVSHNDADCIAVHRHFGIDITDRNWDTLTMAQLCWPGELVSRDLKTLVSQYIGPELQEAEDALYARFRELLGKKPESRLTPAQIGEGFRTIPVDDPVYRRYAGLDARDVRRLAYILLDEMKKKGVDKAWEQERQVRAIATRMRIRGMQTDPGTAEQLLADWGGRLSSALEQFQETNGCSARSTQKVAELLITDGVTLVKRTKPSKTHPEGQWALGKEIVKELLAEYPENEKLQLLQEVADNSNVATFLTTLLGFIDDSGLVHSSISTLGTVTGRWSVTQPAVQTVAKDNPCRSVFVPRPGNVLVSADLGQIEPRVAVGLAEERNLIPDLLNGVDVYSAAANAVFGRGFTADQRTRIKRGILGTLYGSGEATLERQAKMLDGWSDVTRSAIREIRNSWKRVAPAIEAYAKYLQTLPLIRLGSGRYVPQDEQRRYKAINSACQGTARDELMVRTIEISKRYDSYIVMTFHDEIFLDVPVAEVETVCSFVRSVMEMGYAGIPTPTDIEIFPECWGKKGISLEEFLEAQNG